MSIFQRLVKTSSARNLSVIGTEIYGTSIIPFLLVTMPDIQIELITAFILNHDMKGLVRYKKTAQ